MGRAAQFSEKQILQAGLNLEESGQQVSAFAIRNYLGGGSHSRIETVWKHYQEGRAESSERSTSIEGSELPVEIHAMLTNTLESIRNQFENTLVQSYQVAVATVRSSYDVTIEAHKAKIIELENIEQQAKTALDQADIQIVELQARLVELKSMNSKLSKDNHRQLGVIESLQHQIGRLEKHNKNDARPNRKPQLVNQRGLPISANGDMVS